MNDINGAKVATANQDCHIAAKICREFQSIFKYAENCLTILNVH